ncbi:MAG: HEAT repeat domain-containing protein [Sandaracinaceae bacterium]|nr:HEAT repeat domain-containing protein [Sandaracinaceae bacterium]
MLDDLKYRAPWEWPEDAKERLVAALGAEDVDQRRTAAALASDAMDDELAAVVLERAMAADEDEEVRASAAIALGPSLEECDIEGFDHEIAEPPLAEALFERIATGLERLYREPSAPKLVRRRALEAAVRAPRPWQTAAVRAAWASGDTGGKRPRPSAWAGCATSTASSRRPSERAIRPSWRPPCGARPAGAGSSPRRSSGGSSRCSERPRIPS